MIRAAGVLFLAPDNTSLFLKRGDGGDHAGEWCCPGGRIEDEETAAAAAIRETAEEAGHAVKESELTLLTRSVSIASAATTLMAEVVPAGGLGGALPPFEPPAPAPPQDGVATQEDVDFTTFLVRVEKQFTPTLCEEHTGYAWAPVDQPPEPLHPGMRVALDRLTMDELGVARAIADGRLTSPQRYKNITLWDMRITGTGASYRSQLKEHVWRDPSIYMNEEFLARCNGLPVIMEHPKKRATLDSKEFNDRVVGSILLPYLRPEAGEVWGVAKVYDDEANEMMASKRLSTSPSVVLGSGDDEKLKRSDGKTLLIEGKPTLLDHLAICEQGVWDKGGEPAGIENALIVNDSTGGTTVAEEDLKTVEKNDADAGEKLDRFLEKLDSVCERMDAVSKRQDAMEAAREDSAKKKDEEEPKAQGEDEPERVAADKRKDGEEEGEKKEEPKADAEESEAEKAKADAGKRKDDLKEEAAAETEKETDKRSDSALRAELNELRTEMVAMKRAQPKQRSDDDFHALADAQARADGVYQAFGKAAPRPLDGEDLGAYRVRIARDLRSFSPTWKDANLFTVAADSAAFNAAEGQIYNDAMAAALNPADLGDGELREIKSRDVTGRNISTFHGEPRAWMRGFTGSRRRLSGIRQQSR